MRQISSDRLGTPGRGPAEGRPDLDLPGADHPDPIVEQRPGDTPDPGEAPRPDRAPPGREPPDRVPPDSPGGDRPERLGERIEDGPGSGIAGGEPDLVPDVEVPEETM